MMWRALGFLALLALAAFAAVWLADQPGGVTLSWNGYEATTSLAVGVIAIAVSALVLVILWSIVSALLSAPGHLRHAGRAKRRAKGYSAVSRGMVAVGSGDPAAARRHAGEAERLLGREPLALLLKAQAAQISGDRAGAEEAFQRMADDPETRVLGLRGLFVEARRRNDTAAARAFAAEAARLAPSVAWANEATLEAQCADGDWSGALETVRRRASLRILEKDTARRHRAVLLTAEALGREAGEPERATEGAVEAARLAPELVPAAALAARLLARRGDVKKATRIIEAAWRRSPHPDLARTYAGLRTGDSTRDRLRRAETLAKLSNWDAEGRLAVANAAYEAREFATARSTLSPLLPDRPSLRVCLLMARIEEAEHGRAAGGAREWLARATRAPRDPLWIADGVASDHWAPMSPVTGRLDAFVWQTPPDVIAGPSDEFEDLSEPEAADVPPLAPPAPVPAAPPAPVVPAATVGTAAPAPAAPAPVAPPSATSAMPESRTPAPGPSSAPARRGSPPSAKPVIFPVAHAPDDPGAALDPESEAERRRRFG